ncbi:MAG: hypothetical protein ABIO60_06920 [Aquaticitalea sp.]
MKLPDWSQTKPVLETKIKLGIKLLFLFLVVYLLSTGLGHPRIKIPLLCIVFFLVVFYVKSINQTMVWYLFLTVLIFDLMSDYFVRANHHFLMIYMTILVIIFLKNGLQQDFITNIKLLVFIILLFSALQKLLSPQFISGDFYYYMFNTGNFFKPSLRFNPEMNDIVAQNNALILELGKTDPNILKNITLQNIVPNIANFSRIFAWLTVIIEFLTGILILWKPKNNLIHIVFIILILGIFLMRMENGFLCLLTISGVWLSENLKTRFVYVAMTLLFLSFIVNQIGFY